MIILFIISIILLIWVAKIKKISLISTYGFYMFFTVLYNGITYLNIAHNGLFYFSLDFNINLINNQVFYATTCNLAFAAVYIIFYRQVEYKSISRNLMSYDKKNKYIFIYILLFFITLYFSTKYGWNEVSHNYIEENSTAYSLTAYLKYAFISMYLFYIYKYGFNKMLMFLLVLQIILMFFDGARTTFFCIAISTICIYNLEYKPRKLKVLLILGLSLFVIISARAVIMKSTFIGNFVDSINIEAQVGSYMVRQTIYIQSVNESYTFGKTYILDPIMYFLDPITKVLFNKPLRGDLYFDRWINNNSIFLLERYAPMGGFYYISEAIITLPYIGAMIITLMYAIFSVYMENNKNKFRSQYILFLALAPLFIKYKFSNFFTMSLVIIILYYIWGFFDRKNNIKYK